MKNAYVELLEKTIAHLQKENNQLKQIHNAQALVIREMYEKGFIHVDDRAQPNTVSRVPTLTLWQVQDALTLALQHFDAVREMEGNIAGIGMYSAGRITETDLHRFATGKDEQLAAQYAAVRRTAAAIDVTYPDVMHGVFTELIDTLQAFLTRNLSLAQFQAIWASRIPMMQEALSQRHMRGRPNGARQPYVDLIRQLVMPLRPRVKWADCAHQAINTLNQTPAAERSQAQTEALNVLSIFKKDRDLAEYVRKLCAD